MNKLEETRKNIDKVDKEITSLINKRAKLALEIGKVKGKTGKPVYVPSREKEILRNISSFSKKMKGVLDDSALEAIYAEIMSACRNLETPTKVAFLGPWATFTHQAAIKRFGSSGFFVPCQSVKEALKEVESGRADFAVIPVENSHEGSVNIALDILADTDLNVCGEISMKIEQCMLARDPKAKILRIYSHPHALAQCRDWINKHYPDVELISATSTAEAAKSASKETHAAAVASEATAKIYDLKILNKSIQDSKQNFTRFFVLGKIDAQPSGNDKTTLIFMLKDKVGALYKILSIFNKNKVNLTKIESRPTKKKAWEYMFFVDLNGHILENKISKTVDELKKNCVFVKILGSYPKN